MMVLAPTFLVLALWNEWRKGNRRAVMAKMAGFLLAVAVPAALLWALYGCDMLLVYQKALEAQRLEIAQVVHRSFGKWVFGNLGDFFLLSGLPIFVYFLAFLRRTVRPVQNLELGRSLAWTFVGILLLLTLSGLVRGEAGRIWLFLMTFPTVLVAGEICEGERKWPWQGFLLLGLQYLQVISLQTNAVFLKPF
jgi:hypothetical protein